MRTKSSPRQEMILTMARICKLGDDTTMPLTLKQSDIFKSFNLLFSILKGPLSLKQLMSSTSTSKAGQDARTLLKTPTSGESISVSLRVLRSWHLSKEREVMKKYEDSESDVRPGYENEFVGKSIKSS